jgi:hypothetical protein
MTGVAPCDEYLKKVRKCISDRAPDEVRKPLETNLKRTRASWLALAKNPGTRPSLDQTCGLALQAMRAQLQTLSCEW